MATETLTCDDITSQCILFIDDEKKLTEHYIKKLKHLKYAVETCRDASEARSWVDKRDHEVHAYVLDIAMPEEKNSKIDFRTGVRLYHWLRNKTPGTPIAILTNRTPSDVLVDFPEGRSPDKRLRILWKPDCTPQELADNLREMISTTVKDKF